MNLALRKQIRFTIFAFLFGLLAYSELALATFLDARGHYVARGETRTAPANSPHTGMYQAIEQNFRLEGEVRLDDESSVILELRLFDDPRAGYLGDTPKPRNCPERQGSTDCTGRHQNSAEPGYAAFTPKISKAYLRYGFEYCMLEAGRRGRDWGLGVFLDSGEDPFDTGMSIYDGVACDINIQKAQTLGLKLGFDKLSETGTFPYNPHDNPRVGSDPAKVEEFDDKAANAPFGPATRTDDLTQFFLAVEYDNGKLNTSAEFAYKVGIYFANVMSFGDATGYDSRTDIKLLDFYYNFYFGSFSARNEFIVRHGRSGDPNFARLGGTTDDLEAVRNDVQSLAIAGVLEWAMATSGGITGPAEYKEGNLTRHVLFFDYALAPGSSQGYYSTYDAEGKVITDDAVSEVARANQGNKADATALHENYKPALIFFNGKPHTDHLAVDGVFDPYRIMNASLLGLGYRYEDMENGNIEFKLITGQLLEGMPSAVKEYYVSKGDAYTRPIGFYGRDLGYELDIKYTRTLNRYVDLGLAAAYSFPGSAWKTREGESPKSNMVAQSFLTVKF